MLARSTLAVLTSLASLGSAGIARQCHSSGICYSLNIPDSTVSSGSGDIFLQITGPTSNSWIGLAQGRQMAGAHFFVMYTSASGTNVTVSPRVSRGEVMPTYDSATQLELLEGSGVSNGVMTANIRCKNCESWSGGTMDLTAQNTNWLWACKSGSPINSDDVAVDFTQHDKEGGFTFDASARGGSAVNPFLNANGTSTTNSTSSASTLSNSSQSSKARMITAHAALACIAWIAIFPMGGILIRLFSFPQLVWVHASLQVLGLCLFIAAVGLGLKVAIGSYMDRYHVIIGLTLFGIMVLQPLSGFLHHAMFKKYVSRTTMSYLHIWIGRAAITLGIMNAGFGFKLMGKTTSNWEVVVYIVFAVIMWVAYVGSAVFGELKRANKVLATPGQKSVSETSSNGQA